MVENTTFLSHVSGCPSFCYYNNKEQEDWETRRGSLCGSTFEMKKVVVKKNSIADRMNATPHQEAIALKPSGSGRLQPLWLVVACLCCFLVFSGCAKVPYRSDPQLVGYTEHGIASFYSMKYQFRKTASGERFNQMALTAAHRTLPFGTKVRVTNLKNRRSVTVKINDRGPFIKGRIIDLTRYAFSKIGDTEVGLLQVKIEVVN